jgi:hypothetical protein
VHVIGYLELVTDRNDIDLVTVTAYDMAGSRVLVPQRIDPGRRTRELSDAQVSDRQAGVLLPGWAEFRKSFADALAARREMLQRTADWAEMPERDGLGKAVELPR